MYRLATIHSITDRRTDRETVRQADDIIMPIADPCSMISYKLCTVKFLSYMIRTDNERP